MAESDACRALDFYELDFFDESGIRGKLNSMAIQSFGGEMSNVNELFLELSERSRLLTQSLNRLFGRANGDRSSISVDRNRSPVLICLVALRSPTTAGSSAIGKARRRVS
jgi:hypothetical protein